MSTTIDTNEAQRGVWVTERAGVAGGAYQMVLGIWFGAGLDERALEEACAAVVARHPMLSTAVAAPGGEPVLVPAAEKVSLVRDEWSEARVRSEIARRFDLAHGPLARFTLLTDPPDRQLLLFTAHHLVFDGVSKDVLAHDLAAVYRAAVAGQPANLAPGRDSGAAGQESEVELSDPGTPDRAPLTPAAAAGDRVRAGADLAAARELWRTRWSPPGEVILPGLRRVPVEAGPGAVTEITLPAAAAGRLGAVARDLGLTRFELLFAAVQVLLARYGNAGLSVSVALSTRRPESVREIGLFVNELPVSVAPAEGTFRRYAETVRARLREVYSVRAVPLAHAVNGLRPAAALTPVSVSYRRQLAEPEFPGVASTVEWAMPTGAARNALHLQIVDAPTGPRATLQYSPDAIPAGAVARIGAHLSTVLTAVLDDPDQPVAALPVLPPLERQLVLETWNATGRRWPAGASVPALFAARVAERPDAVAVVDRDRTLTYAELDRAAAALSASLRERGAGPGSLVAVSLPRSWRAVVALLAVMRRGAAYVPVDPAYPIRRRELILADADPVLTLDAVEPFDDLVPSPDAGPRGPVVPVRPEPGELAYVMYTSGSTGQPKGVAVPHGALANLLLGMAELLGSGPADRWLALTSLSFDISGLELFLPLVTGGRVVVAAGMAATDGAAVNRLIREQAVSHVQATPSGWRILLDAGFDGRPGVADGSGVVDGPGVVALAGGETLTPALANELRQRVDRLFNVYGPTETTIWSTAEELPGEIGEVTIGRPIANTRAYVLDQNGQPVPIGVAGELHLAGAGVADGYLRQPELTAQRFVSDPFGPSDPSDPGGGRCYRTGDRCRWLPDGRLAYLGRSDSQVKVRGHRVELGEIEAALVAHPAVAEAAVAYLDGDRLVGYLVAQGEPPEPAALRAQLAESLPAVMVPGQWVVMPDRLPRTPNGKLDRAALPAPPHPAQAEPPEPAGADDLLATLCGIWAEVLRVDEVHPDDDLFDLGGHSLSITMIASRIHKRYGIEVPLETFFDAPSAAEIAGVVRAALAPEGSEG